MTYDVQRYTGWECWPEPGGQFVLAADAQAHEKAAVEAARAEWEANGPYFTSVVHACCEEKQTARQQAIRDCIAVVKSLKHDSHCCLLGCTCEDRRCDESCSCSLSKVDDALNALLEGEK